MNTRKYFKKLEALSSDFDPVFHIDETFWGYIIRSNPRPRSATAILQWFSGFFGLTLVFAALGFWLLPGSLFDVDVVSMKFATSASLSLSGMLFLWYATQGTQQEIHIDTNRGELREVLRNPRGHAYVMRRFAFGDIGSVFLERPKYQEGLARLVLRYCNTAQVIEVAFGPELALEQLRDRLARDILGVSKGKRMVLRPVREKLGAKEPGFSGPHQAA